MSATALGPLAVWAAIASALIAVITGRRRALAVSALSASAAAILLVAALVSGDFSLAYVAETTSLATPWPYRVAALWGGMDGSMLFYTTLAIGIGAGALRRPIPVRVVGAVGLGLLLVTTFFANPFTVLDIPAVDGGGLLAILQHPAMIYHPPILYLGLTVLIVPFALTVDMAWRQTDREAWMARVRRWLYASWTHLTIGMAAGANWAYVELGWGGYWAWDPVENTALMPWVAATVFLHSSRLEGATGRWRRWSVMFAGLPFALTVMGVYLTRSGATGSIHSFAEDPVVGRILLVSAAVVALLVLVVAMRSKRGEPWGRVRLDRDGWLAVNAVLLTSVLVFITAGSAYPAFVSVFSGRDVVVDSTFFVVTILPVAVAIAVSLSLALHQEWIRFGLILTAAVAVTLAVTGPHPAIVLMAPAVASLGLLGFGFATRRVRGRRLTIYLAHLGMALFLAGVAGSSFGDEFSGTMMPGDTVNVAGHEVSLETVRTGESDRYQFVRADFDVDGQPIEPEIRAYEEQETPVAEPALRSGLVDDVIVAISLLFPDGDTLEVSVFVRPLVMWVWVGAALMGLAGLVALVSRVGAAAMPRRSATVERQSEGTTSETVSP